MSQYGDMKQRAPYPIELERIVAHMRYKKRWRFELDELDRGQGSEGLTLSIYITGPDSYQPDKYISVVHYMLVPPAAYDERSWKWWVFQQIMLVEQHEAMEFFRVNEEVVYPPAHGPGNDPYLILQYGSDIDRRTLYTGELNE